MKEQRRTVRQTACKQKREREPLPVQQSVQPTTIRKNTGGDFRKDKSRDKTALDFTCKASENQNAAMYIHQPRDP